MKHFSRFTDPCTGRGANINCETKTLTVPDVVPTLKDIILSGSATQVGALLYDDSEMEGVRRLAVQGAPLEMILTAQLDGFPETDDTKEHRDDTEKVEGEPDQSEVKSEGK